MSIREFESLNEYKRYVLWLAIAVEVGLLKDERYHYVLYQLEDFYVELITDTLGRERTIMIAHNGGSRLDRYIEQVDISWIYA